MPFANVSPASSAANASPQTGKIGFIALKAWRASLSRRQSCLQPPQVLAVWTSDRVGCVTERLSERLRRTPMVELGMTIEKGNVGPLLMPIRRKVVPCVRIGKVTGAIDENTVVDALVVFINERVYIH